MVDYFLNDNTLNMFLGINEKYETLSIYKLFFLCYLFSPSLLMNGCLGNIQWGRCFNRSCFLLQLDFFSNLRECFMPTDASFLYLSVFSLSFFNSHPLDRFFFESLFLALRSFGSSPFRDKRPPARLCGRSRACIYCVVSNLFDILLRVGAGIRSCALPKERKQTSKLYVLPQDHHLARVTSDNHAKHKVCKLLCLSCTWVIQGEDTKCKA